MQIIDQTVTVGQGGLVAVEVSRTAGARVRVIVLDESDAESTGLTRGQEHTGFARLILANPAEDVWNEL